MSKLIDKVDEARRFGYTEISTVDLSYSIPLIMFEQIKEFITNPKISPKDWLTLPRLNGSTSYLRKDTIESFHYVPADVAEMLMEYEAEQALKG